MNPDAKPGPDDLLATPSRLAAPGRNVLVQVTVEGATETAAYQQWAAAIRSAEFDQRRRLKKRRLKKRRRESAPSPRALQAGSWLITLATRLLPPAAREDRRREWATELHYILTDPDTPRPLRPLHALTYAADTIRAAPALATHDSNPRRRPTALQVDMASTIGMTGLGITEVTAHPSQSLSLAILLIMVMLAGVNIMATNRRRNRSARRDPRP